MKGGFFFCHLLMYIHLKTLPALFGVLLFFNLSKTSLPPKKKNAKEAIHLFSALNRFGDLAFTVLQVRTTYMCRAHTLQFEVGERLAFLGGFSFSLRVGRMCVWGGERSSCCMPLRSQFHTCMRKKNPSSLKNMWITEWENGGGALFNPSWVPLCPD
ncbi:hypothetical protein IE53DRAFT_262835 [Violaceomyces palustris]|uniref:Uncharacterized protein n=1 Tax=Violaceomyces palustris TaxID=1673888 RepID=A0ACD0NN59_9BASI|nr:hypothetical protein IE53DRAFT_262835 [Violaceomyces palustris]